MLFRQLFDKASSTFTYLIASAKGREALIIDPVLENVEQYIKLLKELDLKLVKVIDTHIHADHISGIAELRDKTNCVTVMGDKTPADVVAMQVADEETIKIDGLELQAIYTPGHTIESFSFLMNDRVFTGDALLIRGTGRTDFQNGNARDSYNSIFNKLLKLPDETLVYPAHDYKGEMVSTIIEEKKFNPRLQVSSVDQYIEIMNNLNLPNPSMMDVAVPSNLQLGIDFNRQKVNNGVEPEKFNEIKNDTQSILIDLREQNEIDKDGMIKNSIVVRFPEINEYLKQNKNTLKDKRILFYCAHGHRSTLAVQLSKSYQFTNCFHLIGGLKNWKKEGLDL
ncbi:MBL fold metallo-hydrolase [Candidatus Pelagibacter ubique]|nr:MBL fold metallo-hydrolase [Candidatus Pelagibacter ubique]